MPKSCSSLPHVRHCSPSNSRGVSKVSQTRSFSTGTGKGMSRIRYSKWQLMATKSHQRNGKQLHQAYLAGGRRYKDLLKVRDKTAQARRYVKQLARERWLDHCTSFGERTGLRKLWQVLRAANGERKHGNLVLTMDLCKAFDTVRHEAIIQTLEGAHPGTRIANMIKAFLHDRTFKICSERSQPRHAQRG